LVSRGKAGANVPWMKGDSGEPERAWRCERPLLDGEPKLPGDDALRVGPATHGGEGGRTPVLPGEKGTPPVLELITAKTEKAAQSVVKATLDDLARAGAQRMIAAALEIEVDEYSGAVPERAQRGRLRAGRAQRARAAPPPADRRGAGDHHRRGRPSTRPFGAGNWRTATTSTSGPTRSISPSVLRRSDCAR
jgi:hypothetical protein